MEVYMDLAKFNALDIILVCGLPGAGKSYFSMLHFKDAERKRVNRKEIRKFIYEMMNFGLAWSEKNFASHDEVLVKHVERKIIEHLLAGKKKILIDNTSVSAHSRKNYIEIAKQMHKSIGVIFLQVQPALCLERNKKSSDPTPEIVISTLSAGIELPKKEEEFNEILLVKE
jgi:predicted kinase